MAKKSRKRRFPREEPKAEKPAPPTSLRHEVREGQPAHSADTVIGGGQISGDNLQMDIIKMREWMSSHQFGLTPQEREKKWDEIRALEGKLRSRA